LETGLRGRRALVTAASKVIDYWPGEAVEWFGRPPSAALWSCSLAIT